jgi:predicted permease
MIHQSFSVELLLNSMTALGISFLIYFLLIALSFPFAKALAAPVQQEGVFRFAFVFSNVGFMGYPVIEAVFGQKALFYTAIYNLPFNLLAFTFGIILLVKGNSTSTIRLELKHFLSPVVISILLGFALFLLKLPLPAPVGNTIKLLGSVTTPMSMVVIGALLAKSNPRYIFTKWRIYVLSMARLVAIPLLIFYTLRLFTTNIYFTAIPAMIAGMPVAANTALLAEEYKMDANLASEMVFISTLLAVATIPFLALFMLDPTLA